ncbi:Glutathione S-transferase 1 [Phytophthora nicotianae]|uniref:Glutathione S-transferase 1 n=2 Tax=Phytophthora nicotianae TaxID=4792 RepID=A0A0W8CR81_PHYNI|nr:Glutathione S-transferase 1 [Phytophthora nicotianae]
MAAFPSIKLTYFNFGGRAEHVRLALYIGGIPFEDKRLSREEFGALKSSFPLGQVPVLEVDGQVLTQTDAILRYVGRLGGLYPTSSPFAALKVDEMLHALCEMAEQMFPSFQEKDEDKKKAMREELAKITIPHYAACIEARLEKMHKLPTFQSDVVYVHEIALFTWMKAFKEGFMDHIPTTILDGYKFHNITFDKVAANQKVKEWYSLPHRPPTKLKLTYFPVAGRAEPIRLAFFIGGIDFEDVRLSFDEYEKVKSELPFNQLPVLEVDGEPVSQSLAILRYVGSLTGLYPTDLLAASHVDEIFVLIDEMFNNPEWRATVRERSPDKQQMMRKNLSNDLIPKTLDFLEKRVDAFKGQYATGSALTVADLALYALILLLKAGKPGIPTNISDPYKNLLRVFDQVKKHPKAIEWNATHA